MNRDHSAQSDPGSFRKRPLQKRLLLGLLALALLTPFGILLPRMFRADGAWGEWDTGRLKTLLGYVPEGMKGSSNLWRAPASDYTFPAGSDSLISRSITYALSGLLGLLLAACLVFLLMKVIKRHEG